MKPYRKVRGLPLYLALAFSALVGCETQKQRLETYDLFVPIEPTFDYKSIKRVAVIEFENRTTDKRAAELMSDGAEAVLVSWKTYEVITRRQLKDLLKEKDFHLSGLIAPEKAREIGKVLAVDALLVGVVQTHKIEHGRTLSPRNPRLRILKKSATVVAMIKLIDTRSGRVLHAREGAGNWWESASETSTKFHPDELILKRARDAALRDGLKGITPRWENRKLKGYPSLVGVELLEEDGRVRVVGVTPGGPGDLVGIRTGDVILRVAGRKVSRNYQVIIAVRRTPVGHKVPVEIDRNGRKMMFEPITVKIPDNKK